MATLRILLHRLFRRYADRERHQGCLRRTSLLRPEFPGRRGGRRLRNPEESQPYRFGFRSLLRLLRETDRDLRAHAELAVKLHGRAVEGRTVLDDGQA